MPQNRLLSQQEREQVLAHVKPQGAFKEPTSRTPFGVQPLPWEEKLGDLDEYRAHKGMGRAIVPVLSDPIKTASVQNSVVTRLRKLHPDESWSTYVEGKSIFLRFNGPKREYERRKGGGPESEPEPNSELFATG